MGFFMDYSPLSARPYWLDDPPVRLQKVNDKQNHIGDKCLQEINQTCVATKNLLQNSNYIQHDIAVHQTNRTKYDASV